MSLKYEPSSEPQIATCDLLCEGKYAERMQESPQPSEGNQPPTPTRRGEPTFKGVPIQGYLANP